MNLSLELVYREFDDSLRKFVLGRVQDPVITEDILQNVYIKIHNNINKLRDEDRLTPWVYKITRNAIIDQYRSNHPEYELPEDLAAPQPESPDIYSELASSVRTMLNCLPTEYREALELADLQGKKQQYVAAQLGLSLSGAKSRVQRARQKLKQAFLTCCHFEVDHSGRLVDFQSNGDNCSDHTNESNCEDQPCSE